MTVNGQQSAATGSAQYGVRNPQTHQRQVAAKPSQHRNTTLQGSPFLSRLSIVNLNDV